MAVLAINCSSAANGVAALHGARLPSNCGSGCTRRCRSAKSRLARSPTACTRKRGSATTWRAVRPLPRPGMAQRRLAAPISGRTSRTFPTANCGARTNGAASGWSPSRARRLMAQLATARGRALGTGARPKKCCDPDALTIGFARRFATYKRATLLFRDLERLKRILHDAERPGADHLRRQGAPARQPAARSSSARSSTWRGCPSSAIVSSSSKTTT